MIETPPIPLLSLSRETGLPARWLKTEAVAGRIPSLRIGRHFRFNLKAVQAAISARAAAGESAKEAGHE